MAAKSLFDVPRPDVIVSLTSPPYLGLIARFIARLRRSRRAHWIMDLYPDVLIAHRLARRNGLTERVLRELTRLELQGADLVFPLGKYMAEKVADYMAQRDAIRKIVLWGSRLVEQPLPGGSAYLRERRGWTPEELVLMYSGNMGLGHRFGEFLDAAERLGTAGPRWAFVGSGRRRAEIEAFHDAHPEARIELLPLVPPDQLSASLRTADVHLVSLDSSWQGLIVPSKTQDAFSTGRPVIFVGGRSNDIADWISESGGGWIVEENDVSGLIQAVAQASDPSERARRGHAALEFARTHFDRVTNCERMVNLLEGLGISGTHRGT